jgi:hypothetical protein
MSNSSELTTYITRVQKRLRLGAWSRGAAVFAGTALVVTLALVLLLNWLAFPSQGVALGRVALLIALASAALFGIAWPLRRLTRERAVNFVESANPEFEQSLTTFQQREEKSNDPMLELLAADTLTRTQGVAPTSLVPDNSIFALGGAGLACLGVLVWMIAAGPGYLGYGASLLWTGGKKNAAPLYAITIAPGNVIVRRNSDQLITAHITGMHPDKAQLFARYQSASGWEPVAMQATPERDAGASFQFVFAGLPEDVEYYVSAGPLLSAHYRVSVVDLPSAKDIRITYKYPAWTGMKPVTEEHSGDLRAIEGTQAQIDLEMDRPLKDGALTLDGGQTIHLAGGANNKYTGTLSMDKDGAYHITANEDGQSVRLSEDYFIATDKAMPPDLSIVRPAGDYRASPIEEVTIGVKAADEFGLKDMHLHYSVNAGPDRDISLLKTPGAKNADGTYTLPLEDFKLEPGGLVSLYATAKDGHSESRTDISFVQVDPFEREFSQSQQSSGGGGNGGGNAGSQTEISKREKELIAATWKQQNDKNATEKDATAQGQFLSEAQEKLRDQVNALSVRMQSRDISGANSEFTDFDKDMQDAVAAMAPSAEKLRSMQWKDAIPLEQRALQALLRAEATFRQIEVAFGQAGGGGGGGNAGRDLASLFDLELDTEKNQYETAQSASPAEQREKDVEDALQKLDALTRRQEDLANQQRNPQQSLEERWQQEMLRREAEQLQRQMEQMAQNGEQSANSSPAGQSTAQQSGSKNQNGSESRNSTSLSHTQNGGQSSASSSNGAADQRIEEALDRLREATEAMRRGDQGGAGTDTSRRAAETLHEAQSLLSGTQQQLASTKLGSLAQEADRLKQDERAQAGRINQFANQPGGESAAEHSDLDTLMTQRRERDQLAQERQQLSDSLSRLQQKLRGAARDMDQNQPEAAQKLRDALTEMDDSDLDNRVQRTADWLRRGINPNANGTESDIALGLDKLSRQLQQAQKAAGQSRPGTSGANQGEQMALLSQVERLREQVESMARSQNGRNQGNQPGSAEQNGAQNGDRSQLNRTGQYSAQNLQRGTGSPQNSVPGQSGQSRPGQGSGGNGFSGAIGNQRGDASGDVRSGGGRGADGTVWNNINTGNNRYGTPRQASAPTDAPGNPADVEQAYRQEMRELSQLRQMASGDPQTAKEVAELTRQMQRLDPSRFPGNPAMVEEMHREVLSSVDRLELQLQRAGISPEARTGKPDAVPAGYQDSVAEYYKRLSKTQ